MYHSNFVYFFATFVGTLVVTEICLYIIINVFTDPTVSKHVVTVIHSPSECDHENKHCNENSMAQNYGIVSHTKIYVDTDFCIPLSRASFTVNDRNSEFYLL